MAPRAKKPPVKTSAAVMTELQRDSQVLKLRQAGLTLEEIGRALDPPVTKQAVSQRLLRLLGEQSEEIKAQAAYLKDIQHTRLEALIRTLWTRALKGELQVIDRLEKLLNRQAALLGLDAPKKVAETDADGNDLPSSHKEALRAKLLAGAPPAGPAGDGL